MPPDSERTVGPPGEGTQVTVEISAELARAIDRYAHEHGQPRSEALLELLSRGLTTMPKGCLCGQVWHEQRRRKQLSSLDPRERGAE